MAEFKVGDQVTFTTALKTTVGTIVHIYDRIANPFKVQINDSTVCCFVTAEDLILVNNSPAELTDFLDAAERSSDLLASVQAEATAPSIERTTVMNYKHGDKYRIVVQAENIPPVGAIVTIEGDQPETAAAVDILYREALYICYPDEIEPVGSVEGHVQTSESAEIDRLKTELAAAKATLISDLAKIHDALRPFIAGGSEYSGVSGDIRAIQEIGERGNRATERSIRLTGEMKTLKAEVARLEEENRALQAANRRLQDKLADEARLHGEQGEEIVRLKARITDLLRDNQHCNNMLSFFIPQSDKTE